MIGIHKRSYEWEVDLLLIVPNLEGYQMTDWFLVVISFVGFLAMIKNRPLGLILLSISEISSAMLGLCSGEVLQALLFFVFFLGMGSSFPFYLEKVQQKVSV